MVWAKRAVFGLFGVLLGLNVASLLLFFWIDGGTVSVGFGRGSVYYFEHVQATPVGVRLRVAPRWPHWRPNAFPTAVRRGMLWRGWVPLWIPTVLMGTGAGALWWLEPRTVRPGHCRACGYNLTGNVSGRCPECGAGVPRGAA